MNDSLYIAATGMHMQQKSVDTIANNLANVNTPGFKKGRISFQDMVYSGLAHSPVLEESQAVRNAWQGGGVNIGSLSVLFTPGDLKKTELPLDLAIQGDGFFEVVTPDGTPAYSRGGSLIVDSDGFLATANGYALKPTIHVGLDARQVVVRPDGQVLVMSGASGEFVEAGRLDMVRFADAGGLVPLGGNLYATSLASGEAIFGKPGEDGLGTVAQGFVESANVNLVEEMVDLMAAQRAYESSVKVIQASDEMLSMSNNLRK